MRRVVLDTNVLVSALRSRRGAAFRLVSLVGRGRFEIALSVPLVLEYEATLLRHLGPAGLTKHDIADLIDYLCRVAIPQEIFYLWRPYLRDPHDDMVLELAVAAGCGAIITYNQRDFAGAERFGIRLMAPYNFLRNLGVLR